MQGYNDAFDKLLQDFRDRATGDTLVVVRRIWEDLTNVNNLRESVLKYPPLHPADI